MDQKFDFFVLFHPLLLIMFREYITEMLEDLYMFRMVGAGDWWELQTGSTNKCAKMENLRDFRESLIILTGLMK